MVKPFFEIGTLEKYTYYIQSLADFKEYTNANEMMKYILQGYTVVIFQEKVLLFEFKLQTNKEVLDASVETTIHGPQKAQSENLETNLNLIRQRYHTNALIVEKIESIGDKTNMDLAILYDESMIKKRF